MNTLKAEVAWLLLLGTINERIKMNLTITAIFIMIIFTFVFVVITFSVLREKLDKIIKLIENKYKEE